LTIYLSPVLAEGGADWSISKTGEYAQFNPAAIPSTYALLAICVLPVGVPV
jgi:hypothetical protein